MSTSRLYPADKIKDASDSGGSNIEHDNDVESERTNLFVKEIPDILDRVILIAAVNLEFGVLPIQYEVELRKLYFLKSILQKSHDDPVRMVYNEMLKYPCEKNWANEVMGLRIRYGLSTDDWHAETTGINEWKRYCEICCEELCISALKEPV